MADDTFWQGYKSDLADAAKLGLVALMFSSPAVFAYQCYVWLRDGIWPALPLRDYIDQPVTQWAGLEKILTYAWNCPLSAALLVATMLAIWLGTLILEARDTRYASRLADQREKQAEESRVKHAANYQEYLDNRDPETIQRHKELAEIAHRHRETA